MAAVPYAHIVAKILDNKKSKGAIITLAPNPKDIVRPHFFFGYPIPLLSYNSIHRFGRTLSKPTRREPRTGCSALQSLGSFYSSTPFPSSSFPSCPISPLYVHSCLRPAFSLTGFYAPGSNIHPLPPSMVRCQCLVIHARQRYVVTWVPKFELHSWMCASSD